MQTFNVLILPGLYNSGEKHWQTHREHSFDGFRRVQQAEWDAPVCNDWVETLEHEVARCEGDVVLVAHSLACTLVAKWAGKYPRKIKGAFLVAPAIPKLKAIRPAPRALHPFHSRAYHSGRKWLLASVIPMSPSNVQPPSRMLGEAN